MNEDQRMRRKKGRRIDKPYRTFDNIFQWCSYFFCSTMSILCARKWITFGSDFADLIGANGFSASRTAKPFEEDVCEAVCCVWKVHKVVDRLLPLPFYSHSPHNFFIQLHSVSIINKYSLRRLIHLCDRIRIFLKSIDVLCALLKCALGFQSNWIESLCKLNLSAFLQEMCARCSVHTMPILCVHQWIFNL